MYPHYILNTQKYKGGTTVCPPQHTSLIETFSNKDYLDEPQDTKYKRIINHKTIKQFKEKTETKTTMNLKEDRNILPSEVQKKPQIYT